MGRWFKRMPGFMVLEGRGEWPNISARHACGVMSQLAVAILVVGGPTGSGAAGGCWSGLAGVPHEGQPALLKGLRSCPCCLDGCGRTSRVGQLLDDGVGEAGKLALEDGEGGPRTPNAQLAQ